MQWIYDPNRLRLLTGAAIGLNPSPIFVVDLTQHQPKSLKAMGVNAYGADDLVALTATIPPRNLLGELVPYQVFRIVTRAQVIKDGVVTRTITIVEGSGWYGPHGLYE